MPIVPVYGHHALKERFIRLIHRGNASPGDLPGSILLQGPRGIGKQRLALWLAQMLVCDDVASASSQEPCGRCPHCRLMEEVRHPDVYWFYPRPRLKGSDPDFDDVIDDYADATAERVEDHGLYPPASGSDGLFVITTRTIVQKAALAPSIARRKVFIIGDAERMVSQEGADQAANAFLKLLEEPPADTTIILTSSEPGALLPTIRSRVVAFRCAPLSDADMHAFLENALVDQKLDGADGVPVRTDDRIAFAKGAPGVLFGADRWRAALDSAQQFLDAAETRDAGRYTLAISQGVANARGAFSETLDALIVLLNDRAKSALRRGDHRGAYRASLGVGAVQDAQLRAEGNVNPQLLSARLLSQLAQR